MIPATAEFHPAGAGFLHHSLADFQSDTLNEIPKGQNGIFEVRNGAAAELWLKSEELFFYFFFLKNIWENQTESFRLQFIVAASKVPKA